MQSACAGRPSNSAYRPRNGAKMGFRSTGDIVTSDPRRISLSAGRGYSSQTVRTQEPHFSLPHEHKPACHVPLPGISTIIRKTCRNSGQSLRIQIRQLRLRHGRETADCGRLQIYARVIKLKENASDRTSHRTGTIRGVQIASQRAFGE